MAKGEKLSKDIKYSNKDFGGIKKELMSYAKNYFPTAYNDFSSASPGMMFMEMTAYVGDVLSYYTDYSMKENMIQHAQERKNLYSLAQSFGYKPKVSVASVVTIDAYMEVPATGTGATSAPDFDYAPILLTGLVIKSTDGVRFTTINDIDFASESSEDVVDISISRVDGSGQPTHYILKKSVQAVSGEGKTKEIVVGDPEKYIKMLIDDNEVIGIDKVVDADANTWYEVPYLAQDTLFESHINSSAFDPTASSNSKATPYILSLRKTTRRFVTNITAENKIEIQFGSGISSDPDVEIIPSPSNVGKNIIGSSDNMDVAFDPSNFLYTNTYGQVPANTTLTVHYSTGYGIKGNVDSDQLTTIVSGKSFSFRVDGLNNTLKTAVEASLTVNNKEPATGGKSTETLEEVRNNALAHFSTQQRAVTREDYIIRAYSLPSKFGSVNKVCMEQDSVIDNKTEEKVNNPLALNMYVLGYNKERALTNLNMTTKNNLKKYLSQYRLMTDSINIKNGYIINMGINFSIVVLPGRNSKEVVIRCIDALKKEYHIDRMHFNQPIVVKDTILTLAAVDGVQSVMQVDFVNKWRESGGYSGNKYDLELANQNGIIYPSLDPACFEIKFPNKDIRGEVVTY
tara:strand:+ start:4287 stop:6167 length:1881 start_codon:yes stop_codon:yes gene_type:complete